MRQSRILWSLIVLLLGARGISFAQQVTLPAPPSNSPGATVPAPAGDSTPQVLGTLQTTTVQTTQQRFDPNIKVSGDQYYHQIGTTGSFRVNTDRAKQLQEEALQRARLQKRLKEDATATQPIRLTYESKLVPNEPSNTPGAPASTPESRGPVGSPNPGGSEPPDDPNAYVKMPGSGGSLVGRLKNKKTSNSTEISVPAPAYQAPTSEAIPTPTPLPPAMAPSEVPDFDTSAFNLPPTKKKLFSKFRASKDEPSEDAGFAAMEEPSVVATPVPRLAASVPSPPPAAPKPLSVFRPSSDARRANEYSMVKGQEIHAMVDGEPLKLSEGTRVKVLRVGTERSLILLYDNRQATITNSALVPSD